MTREARLDTRRTLGSVVFVFLAALAVRLVNLDRPPFWDELYHLLSARSLLENGTLEIVEGGAPYTRAEIYTHAVAWSFRLIGESLAAARLTAVLSGAALVAGMFAWVRRVADRRSAWILAFFLCLDPLSITTSQVYRFYTLHALLFWIGAVSAFHLVAGVDGRFRLAVGSLVGVAALAAAYQLQSGLSLIGAAALLVSGGLVLGVRWARDPRAFRERKWIVGLLVVGGLAAIGGAIAAHDLLLEAWARYRDTAVWGTERADRSTFYHGALLGLYPTLWSLFPLLALLAMAAVPAVSVFSASIFGVGLLLLSFAAQKADRYLFFLLPGFFVVASIALAHAAPRVRRRVEAAFLRLPGLRSSRSRSLAGRVALLAVVVFALGANRAFVHTADLILAPDAATYHTQPDWTAVADWFRDEVDSSAIVLTSAPTKALYFLGRVDVSLDSRQLEGRPEFSPDPWVRAPIVSEPESLERIIACNPRGLALIEEWHWKRPWYVPASLADLLERRAERVAVESEPRVLVFRWSRPLESAPDGCTAPGTRVPEVSAREPLANRTADS